MNNQERKNTLKAIGIKIRGMKLEIKQAQREYGYPSWRQIKSLNEEKIKARYLGLIQAIENKTGCKIGEIMTHDEFCAHVEKTGAEKVSYQNVPCLKVAKEVEDTVESEMKDL